MISPIYFYLLLIFGQNALGQMVVTERHFTYRKESFPSCEDMWRTLATPFVVLLLHEKSGNYFCMGSIIDHSHVLTARTCMRYHAESVLCLTGNFKPYWGKNSQVRHVDRIIRHEKDMALLRVQKPFKFTDYIGPAIILKADTTDTVANIYKTPYAIGGVGVKNEDEPGKPVKRDLYYDFRTEFYVLHKNCLEKYKDADSNFSFCLDGKGNFCWGAKGSPCIVVSQDKLVQVGVVTEPGCRGTYTHVVRTDVQYTWISRNSFVRDSVDFDD